jgi:hypothetical protein
MVGRIVASNGVKVTNDLGIRMEELKKSSEISYMTCSVASAHTSKVKCFTKDHTMTHLLLNLAPRREDVSGEWRYRSTHS